ncbi:9985_t:CDS:2, partial [Scutellospora calospora]
MSKTLKDQFDKDWLTPWEGKTNSIRICDINTANEILGYLDNAKNMNYKKMYYAKRRCIGIIYHGFVDWPFGHTDECCQDANDSFYTNDLSFDIFNLLLNKANILYGDKLNLQGNDMELFHYKSGGPYHITGAPLVMERNIKFIESLIIDFKFIPFPPRIRNEEGNVPYPSFDGFENNKQLNVIARSILLDLKLVNFWKKIGYHNICDHVNSL